MDGNSMIKSGRVSVTLRHGLIASAGPVDVAECGRGPHSRLKDLGAGRHQASSTEMVEVPRLGPRFGVDVDGLDDVVDVPRPTVGVIVDPS
jgi:hypothetical protein